MIDAAGYLSKGKSFCNRNSVREDVVVDHVIDAIEYEYLNPKTIQRLRKELRRQTQHSTVEVDAKPLKKQLVKVEKDLDTVRRNSYCCWILAKVREYFLSSDEPTCMRLDDTMRPANRRKLCVNTP